MSNEKGYPSAPPPPGDYRGSDPPPPYPGAAPGGGSMPPPHGGAWEYKPEYAAGGNTTSTTGYGPPPGNYGGYPGQSGGNMGQPPMVVAGGMPGTTTIVVTQPRLGPQPVHMNCPKCMAQIVTEITANAGTLAWLICVLCVVFGFWLGCCLIPFCMNECQDVEHRCPNCKAYLGTYHRM